MWVARVCERCEITVIVRYDRDDIRRTCGSVRSGLSVLAWLVTTGLEATETTSLHRPDERNAVRRAARLPASMQSEG